MIRPKQTWYIARVGLLAIALLSGSKLYSQVLAPDLPVNRPLILAEEQYREGCYALAAGSASEYLSRYYAGNVSPQNDDVQRALYLQALSYLETGIPHCADSAATALHVISNPAYSQLIDFALAQYYFRQGNLAQATPLYENASNTNLDAAEIADKNFELAYCYFTTKQFEKAEPLLKSIVELKDGKYYLAGNYYYGLLSYNENRYDDALRSFDRIRDAKEYRSVVPYYVAEIYYFMGERDKALKLADSLINLREKSYYDKELHLLAAQCLFEEQQYGGQALF